MASSSQNDVRQRHNVPNSPQEANSPYSNGYQGYSKAAYENQGELSSNADNSQRKYASLQEYSEAVRQWCWQYHTWNSMNTFYSNLSLYTMCNMYNQFPGSCQSTGENVPGVDRNGNINFMNVPNPRTGETAEAAQVPGPGRVNLGTRYKIPSLWRRVTAEFIDFFLLFIIKLAVTLLSVEYMGLVDIDQYDLDQLLNQDIDYNVAFAMTSELIAMEVINRIFICIFETLCIRRGIGGIVGGATPGKRMMGLKVISCEEVLELPDDRVYVIPAQDMGFLSALVRSVIKNFSLAFFFPVCFTVFFFQHNRAAYDVISNSIVVQCRDDEMEQQQQG